MEDLLVAGRVEHDFHNLSRDELIHFINDKKKELEGDLCILEHNFQLDDLLQFADVVDDTSSLLKMTRETEAAYLVYCGARFFTEAGAILCSEKTVIQANMKADCPLTNDVDEEKTERIFNGLKKICSNELVPMIYFTGSYKLKSFCGKNNGACCTAFNAHNLIEYFFEQKKSIFFTPMSNIALNVAASSELRSFCGENNGSVCMPWNAYKVIKYYLDQAQSVFFIPANDAFNIITALNLPDDQVYVVDSRTDFKNIPDGKKIYAWNVECFVHKKYTVDDIKNLRKKYQDQGIKIIAHKECAEELKDLCDDTGFVGEIYEKIKTAPSGACLGIVTVDTWVSRAAYEFDDKTIVSPRTDLVCGDLRITDLTDVAKSFQSIIDYENGIGSLVSEHLLPDDLIDGARKAYETMFSIDKCAS